jgi:hypothetical protein
MTVPRSSLSRRTALLLALSSPLLFSCSDSDSGNGGVTPPDPPAPDPGAIAGSVQDDAGQGVPGASIALSGGASRSATSAADGSFSFADLEPGAYQVAITPPTGFQLAQGQASPVNVTVSSGQTSNLTMLLDRQLPAVTGEVEGHIRLGGEGVQGVVVSLEGPAGPAGEVTTEDDGQYRFEDLEAGEYSVTVTLPAAFRLVTGEESTKAATVTGGGTVDLDFDVELAQQSPVVQISLTSGLRFVGPSGGGSEVVARGTTIRWINEDNMFHTVTPQNHSAWDRTETNAPGVVLEVLLINPGTLPYFCEPHQGAGMTGTIVVQ